MRVFDILENWYKKFYYFSSDFHVEGWFIIIVQKSSGRSETKRKVHISIEVLLSHIICS